MNNFFKIISMPIKNTRQQSSARIIEQVNIYDWTLIENVYVGPFWKYKKMYKKKMFKKIEIVICKYIFTIEKD